MVKSKELEKLGSLFKEEQWGRIEPRDIGVSKFKILDDLFNASVSDGIIDDVITLCKTHMEEHPDSITAIYLTGLIGFHKGIMEDSIFLRKLIDTFINNHKWVVVEMISEKILEYGENSIALRSLALSLERQGRSKDAIPVLENLLKIDRFDADVAKKLSLAILEEDPERSTQYMKLSIEGFIKNGSFDEVESLWNKLISLSWSDIAFFERIEHMLNDAKQTEIAAGLLKMLYLKYKDEDIPEQSLELLKKILFYRPDDTHARKELIKFYKIIYGDHSQFDQLLELSKLNEFKFPAKFAIQDFEKNIVFDKGNFAYHNTWKLGRINDIDNDQITISFKDKEHHKMSIKMAIQSLMPIGKDHLYVQEFEDPERIEKLFEEDFMGFFKILVKSYDGKILLADIKRELIPKYINEKDWSKWWSRIRTRVKKDPLFGVSDKKKDLIFMRDKPVTFVDELLENFTKSDSYSTKLDIAIEFINNIDEKEGQSVVQYFVDYFTDQIKGASHTKQILSYFILLDFTKFIDPSKLKLTAIKTKINNFIKESSELPILSMKIGSYDYKKNFVNLIKETRDDWDVVVADMLFESPVRIHKYIFNHLIRNHSYKLINNFIDSVILGAKEYPEIFIWIVKNLFSNTWDYSWLDYSRNNLVIAYFRLMNDMKKIESSGNRLKNITLDILFNNENEVSKMIIAESDINFIRKVYNLFTNVSYLEDEHLNTFLELINEKYPDFSLEGEAEPEDEWEQYNEKSIVTQEGYDRKKAELEKMVNSDLVNITKELSKVSEASSDARENVEYRALMEKQSILEVAISKIDQEMKKVNILELDSINTDSVNIGTKVELENVKSGEKFTYSILGPWDADFEKGILSYRSPIARTIFGKKTGDKTMLRIDDEEKNFKVVSISRFM